MIQKQFSNKYENTAKKHLGIQTNQMSIFDIRTTNCSTAQTQSI